MGKGVGGEEDGLREPSIRDQRKLDWTEFLADASLKDRQ